MESWRLTMNSSYCTEILPKFYFYHAEWSPDTLSEVMDSQLGRLILHVLFSGCFEPRRHTSLLFLNLFLTLLLKPRLKRILLIIHIMETDHWSHSVSLFPMYIRAPWVWSILIFLVSLWVSLSYAAALAGPVTGKNIDDRVWNLLQFVAAGLDVLVAVRFDCCFIGIRGNLEITLIDF